MPSQSKIDAKWLKLVSADPAASGTSAAGFNFGTAAAGHITRNTNSGKDFRQLPTFGNAALTSCPGVNRIELIERFEQRPALKAVLDTFTASVAAAEMVAAMIANRNFSVLGSNMTTALCTFATGGGITLTTAGGANTTDSSILLPSLSTNQTAWTSTLWNTNFAPAWETTLQIAAVTTGKVWAGFKLTNTDVAATDNDQCYFVFDTANTLGVSATNWVAVSSRTDVDIAIDTGVPVVAATPYSLAIQIDQNRVPYFLINGQYVAIGDNTETAGVTTSVGALVANKSFIPYVGAIQKTNSAAVAVTVREVRASRNFL